MQLLRHFGKDEKERYLNVVKTIARQLSMTPFFPSMYLSGHFAEMTSPKFIASIPRVKLSCDHPSSIQAALALMESQLQMEPASRTEITLCYSAKKTRKDLFESLLATAELHGNCRFNISESGAGDAIAAAAKKNLLHSMSFFPGSKTGTADVAFALKGNTSTSIASIAISKPMKMDDLLLALSRLPCLHRLEIYLPGPSASPALAEMVRSSNAVADLKIMSSSPLSASKITPDAAMIHARAALKLALETRGPSFRYEIDPVYLPDPPAVTAPGATKE
jgi:hypothetical protein